MKNCMNTFSIAQTLAISKKYFVNSRVITMTTDFKTNTYLCKSPQQKLGTMRLTNKCSGVEFIPKVFGKFFETGIGKIKIFKPILKNRFYIRILLGFGAV